MFMSVTVTVPAGAWKTPVRVGSQTVIDAIGVVVLQVMPAADQLPLPPTVAPLPNQYRSAPPARPPARATVSQSPSTASRRPQVSIAISLPPRRPPQWSDERIHRGSR